ncbi:MAG: hypothetical protein GXO18_01915 [Aquificae bacterium]|nr:hypothetical protein [Aquificota bacterium]
MRKFLAFSLCIILIAFSYEENSSIPDEIYGANYVLSEYLSSIELVSLPSIYRIFTGSFLDFPPACFQYESKKGCIKFVETYSCPGGSYKVKVSGKHHHWKMDFNCSGRVGSVNVSTQGKTYYYDLHVKTKSGFESRYNLEISTGQLFVINGDYKGNGFRVVYKNLRFYFTGFDTDKPYLKIEGVLEVRAPEESGCRSGVFRYSTPQPLPLHPEDFKVLRDKNPILVVNGKSIKITPQGLELEGKIYTDLLLCPYRGFNMVWN